MTPTLHFLLAPRLWFQALRTLERSRWACAQYLPLCTFASGFANSCSCAGTMRTAQALYSGILARGSNASMVSRLAAASTKCIGTKTTFLVVRSVTTAFYTLSLHGALP